MYFDAVSAFYRVEALRVGDLEESPNVNPIRKEGAFFTKHVFNNDENLGMVGVSSIDCKVETCGGCARSAPAAMVLKYLGDAVARIGVFTTQVLAFWALAVSADIN
jgi:hypothetical protein